MLVTADNMWVSFWDCVFHWEAIADNNAYFTQTVLVQQELRYVKKAVYILSGMHAILKWKADRSQRIAVAGSQCRN